MFKRTKVCSAVLVTVGGGLLFTGAPALAQGEQRVEITGSAIRSIDVETALPVQIITREEIARTGVVSTEALLQSLPALSSAGGTSNSEGMGLSTYGNSTLSLRGLEDTRTLVLVNGRRIASHASGGAVDVNAIPIAAIERIEVLKDGASSIYGSDAMAGVVNFILVKSMKGVELSAYASSPSESGGGKTRRAAIVAGFGEGSRFRGVVSGSFEKETALFGRDRDFTKSANKLPFYTSGATGQGNIEGAVIPGAYPNDRVAVFGGSPGVGYGNPMADLEQCDVINMAPNPTRTNKISPTLDVGAPYCAFDTGPFVGLIPARELATLTGNFSFELNQSHELFADVLYSKSEVQPTFQASPLRRSFAAGSNLRLEQEGVDPSLIIYPSNPNYQLAADYLNKYGYVDSSGNPLAGQPLAITARVFDFGGRQSTDTNEQTRVVVGSRGIVVDQDYEVAFSHSKQKLDGKWTGGTFSVTDYNRIINDPNSDWNPWVPGGAQVGALAERLQEAAYIGPSLTAESTSYGFDGLVSGQLFAMGGGAAQYAAGFQTRKDRLIRTPAPIPETGDISGAGGAAFAIDEDRSVRGVFGEVSLPVIKGLELSLSARSDNYSDFGTASTYKVGGSWRPTRQVLLRASVNTGFRAPSLPELYQPQVLGTTEQFDDPATGQTDLQVKGITGGNPNLTPEESRASAIGIVFSPIREVTLGIDFWKIRIDDIIQTPGAQEVVSRFRAGDPAYQNLVVLAGNDVDTITTVTSNLGKADVEGIDVLAALKTAAGPGTLDVNFNGTYMSKFNQTTTSGATSRKVGTLVEADGTPVLGADEGGVILRWKHTLAFSYTFGDWTTAIAQNYTSRYRAGNDLNDNPTYISGYSLFDAAVGYRGFKNLQLTLGAKNLTNKVPDTFVPVGNQFQSGYDVTQYDPRGRTIYVSANYKFD